MTWSNAGDGKHCNHSYIYVLYSWQAVLFRGALAMQVVISLAKGLAAIRLSRAIDLHMKNCITAIL